MTEGLLRIVRDEIRASVPDYGGQEACAETDPEIFFPVRLDGEDRDEWNHRVNQALDVCLSCRVVGECDSAAEARDERYGIWGGVFREEPHRTARARARQRQKEKARAASA